MNIINIRFVPGGSFLIIAVGQNYDPSFLFSLPKEQRNVHLIPGPSGLNKGFGEVISKQISGVAS